MRKIRRFQKFDKARPGKYRSDPKSHTGPYILYNIYNGVMVHKASWGPECYWSSTGEMDITRKQYYKYSLKLHAYI